MGAANAAPASTKVFDIGVNPSGYDKSVNVHTGSFVDTFKFSIDQTSDAFSAGSYTTQIARKTVFDISDFTISLFRDGVTDTLLASSGAKNSVSLNAFDLTAGDYFYTVSGNVLGTKPGKFDFRVDVLPVPEPETGALMLAGLGLLGFVARRKAKSQA